MWDLARQNADVLRMSTLVTAEQVRDLLASPSGRAAAVDWCRRHGISRVYVESFRAEVQPEGAVLEAAAEAFRRAGIDPAGCITPAKFGKRGNGWPLFSCYSAAPTRRKLRAMSRYAARFFDCVMIDDFLGSDCTCPECRRGRGGQRWSEYKCRLMRDLSRTHIIGAGREVNPDVEFILKYPAWYEMYQERGYDVAAQSRLFSRTWAGTETRGLGAGKARLEGYEPQYKGAWIMRWLSDIGGPRCGGGWHDSLDTSPEFYVEQNRQSILGGAREIVLFNYGHLREGSGHESSHGPADLAALRSELSAHFDLARLVSGAAPRGLLGWKPPGSTPGPDFHLHPLLGMAGLPVTASAEFDRDAAGFVFGCHVLHDPGWWDALEYALDSGKPVVCTEDFPRAIAAPAEGNRLSLAALRDRAVILPRLTEHSRWPLLEAMDRGELSALRNRAMQGMGRLNAPMNVALYLFDDDTAVVENFRDEPVRCTLALDGRQGYEPALAIPQGGGRVVADGAEAELELHARSLLALRAV